MRFTPGNEINHDQTEHFLQELRQLQESGDWNINLADCFPMAVADMLNSTVRIYSSTVATPVYELKPRHMAGPSACFSLAYLAIRGEEHYEAVLKYNAELETVEANDTTKVQSEITQASSSVSNEQQTYAEEQDTSIPTQMTPHKRAHY